MELKKGYVLKQSDLKKDIILIKNYDWVNYLISINGKKYLVYKQGKCNPKKCNSACCKVYSMVNNKYCDGEPYYNYWKGFSNRKLSCHILFDKRCKFLDKKGLCVRWKKKDFPGVCKEFPHPGDGVYTAVVSKCSFKFVIDEVIQ